jgi:hypothetical protein
MQRGSRSQTNRESVFVKCGARSVRWQIIAAKAPLASLAAAANRHKFVRRLGVDEVASWPFAVPIPDRGSFDKPVHRKVGLQLVVLRMFARRPYSLTCLGWRPQGCTADRSDEPAASCFFSLQSRPHQSTRKSHCARSHMRAGANNSRASR